MKNWILILLCAGLLAGCAAQPGPGSSASVESAEPETAQTEPKQPEPQAPPTAEARAAELLASLTTEQKVGQLFFARVPASGAAEDVAAYHLGGYILFGRDCKDKTANELIQAMQSYRDAAKIPLLIGADEEGGTVVRVSSNPHLRSERFRSPQQLYAAGGMDAVLADTREKDVLLRALGFNVNLAPVADVSTDPGDFMYDRSFGRNARETADYVAAVTRQMSLDGMGSVLKHFPGYGDNADTHTGVAVDNRPLEQFEAEDFQPFLAGLNAGGETGLVPAVLVSHNIVTCLDPDLPASLSPAVHQKIRAYSDTTVVMTDDLVMDALKAYTQKGSAAVLAVLAGNDLLIATDYQAQIPQVLAAVEDGTISQERLDEAAGRVLTWKAALGLL